MVGSRLGGFAGTRVLDAFAGSGALGLEALSRGAEHAVFIDKNRAALALCRRNAESLGLAARSTFVAADAVRPPAAESPCDLVLLDPPYGEGLGGAALAALADSGWIRMGGLAVVEADRTRPASSPPGFAVLAERDYGRTRIVLLERTSAESDDSGPAA